MSNAEILVNIGLENRAIASTLMNATSSRSHTILSIYVETQKQKGDSREFDGNSGKRSRRKLMLVDLAGSERVRRSSSQGTRLAEAKSINSSLSALGNVIAALADLNGVIAVGHTHQHIPYRGSKLTKLLQDSLGGSASTALIATVGPAARNHGETLSTLQFAHRCMSVKGMHQLHVEGASDVDYISECVGLREELSFLEIELSRQQQISAAQVRVYDAAIRQLYGELALTRRIAASSKAEFPPHLGLGQENFDFDKLGVLIDQLSAAAVSFPLAEKESCNAAGMQEWRGLMEDDLSQRHGGTRTSHRDYTPENSATPGSAMKGFSQMRGVGGAGHASHIGVGIGKAYSDDVSIRSMEVARMRREDLNKRSSALSSLLPQIAGSVPNREAYFCSRLPSKVERTPLQRRELIPSTTNASSSEAIELHDHCGVHYEVMLPGRNSSLQSDGIAPSGSSQRIDDLQPRGGHINCSISSGEAIHEGKDVDGVEVCDLVDQIRSLSASQLALLNPAMREQVMAIRRLAESDADVADSRCDDRDKTNADTEWSSKSSDRPLYWQHRYRNYSVVECDYLSERD